MTGLFGGVLGLVNFTGGVILFMLVGGRAWRESDVARGFRLFIGAVLTSLAMFAAFLLMDITQGAEKPTEAKTLLLFGCLILSISGVFGLEGLRKKLD